MKKRLNKTERSLLVSKILSEIEKNNKLREGQLLENYKPSKKYKQVEKQLEEFINLYNKLVSEEAFKNVWYHKLDCDNTASLIINTDDFIQVILNKLKRTELNIPNCPPTINTNEIETEILLSELSDTDINDVITSLVDKFSIK